MSKITPTRNNVFFEEIKTPNTTSSGIIVESTQVDMKKARAIAVGPECTEVKEGDIFYPTWPKTNVVKIDGELRGIIKEDDIIAIIEE